MRYCPKCETEYDDTVVVCPNDEMRTVIFNEAGWDDYKGQILDDRWKLISLLGEGGMGAVFRGEQMKIQREVAVKLIRQELATDQAVLSRFFREAQVLSNLQHPHVVKLFDFGQDKTTQTLYLVMELLRGQSLDTWIGPEAEQILSLKQVLQFTQQLSSALAEAHSQGVVHRDLKPENLFLRETLGGGVHLVVIDFGIAKVDDASMAKLTQTGFIQGTPYYMAPEQIEGRPITPAADLYSVGVILYEILSGAEPFQGDSAMQIFMQHLTQSPEPLTTAWALHEEPFEPLIDLVQQLMCKKPEDRPKSALEVQNECEAMLAYLNGQDSSNPNKPNTYQRLRQFSADPLEATPQPEVSPTPPPAVSPTLPLTPEPLPTPQQPPATNPAPNSVRRGILLGILSIIILGVLGGFGAAFVAGVFDTAPDTAPPTNLPPKTLVSETQTSTPPDVNDTPKTPETEKVAEKETPPPEVVSKEGENPTKTQPNQNAVVKKRGSWAEKNRNKPTIPDPKKGASKATSPPAKTPPPKEITPKKEPKDNLKGILDGMRNPG